MQDQIKIVIATPLYPPDAGGPSYYSEQLEKALKELGYTVSVVSFSPFMKYRSGVRHAMYAKELFTRLRSSELLIILDTASAALPGVLVAAFLRKKSIVRAGGDFLWEMHVERTRKPVLLKDFYTHSRGSWSLKDHFVFLLTKYMIFRLCSRLVFSTNWQFEIMKEPYAIKDAKTAIIENYYGPKKNSDRPSKKVFFWWGRPLFLKNLHTLNRAFGMAKKKNPSLELITKSNVPRDEIFNILKSSYVTLIPSLSEVSPNQVLESLQYDKPCIVTDQNGILNRVGGVVVTFDPNSAEELSEKILVLADDANYANVLGHVSEFKHQHSYLQIAQEFLSVYNSIK